MNVPTDSLSEHDSISPSESRNRRQLAGWLAVSLTTLITCFWAGWGIIENFHEGWYYESWLANTGLMFIQYLSPMLIFMGLTLITILWPRLGAGLYIAIALIALWFFNGFDDTAVFFIIMPLVGLAMLYWFGRIQSRRIATCLAVGLPFLTLIVCSVEPIYRVSTRVFDGNLGARDVQGNGVTLTWAPDGHGWPQSGMSWQEAQNVCSRLTEDGLTVTDESQNLWRLPSADEAVRSMARHGENSGGIWNMNSAEASYQIKPDKESPLWNVHSQVVYWWTATEIDANHAYIIAYDGQVWPRLKTFGPAYLGFRCVKQP